jgi:hypothetical protein
MTSVEPQAPTLPYLPNEVKIHILSFITDPYFLWTTCRHVSRAFKQWSEEQYAKRHLPKLLLQMRISTKVAKVEIGIDAPGSIRVHPDYLFRTAPVPAPDALHINHRIRLKLDHPDSSSLGSPTHAWRGSFQLLARLHDYKTVTTTCQAIPETGLGLRVPGQEHVCACRSIGAGTRRGLCERYVGAEKFFDWDSEEEALLLSWREFLDYVHSGRCKDRRGPLLKRV